MTLPILPTSNPIERASKIWTDIDSRIQTSTDTAIRRFGVPRSRPLTINIPIVGTATAAPGWVNSVCGMNDIVLVGWIFHALTAGSISINLLLSVLGSTPSSAPTILPINGSGVIGVTGYTDLSFDLSTWTRVQIPAGSFINAYIVSVTTVQQAVLVLKAIDMNSKVLTP
jgi:hypothetical protein